MLQVAALTVFALLMARVMRAPSGTWRYVLGAAAAALAASQLLPAGNVWRADVAGSARTLFWIGLGLIPVAAYAVALRGLRRRVGTDTELRSPAAPRGLVQFTEDAALVGETAAALLADAPGAGLSLGWRGTGGGLVGHLRLRLHDDLAEVELLRVLPAARRGGVGGALLRAGEGEARKRGIGRIGALVGDWQAPAFFEHAGYCANAALDPGRGGARRWMEKPL